jgi:hypothetical protein
MDGHRLKQTARKFPASWACITQEPSGQWLDQPAISSDRQMNVRKLRKPGRPNGTDTLAFLDLCAGFNEQRPVLQVTVLRAQPASVLDQDSVATFLLGNSTLVLDGIIDLISHAVACTHNAPNRDGHHRNLLGYIA